MEIEVIARGEDKRNLVNVVALFYEQTLNLKSSKYKLTISLVPGLKKLNMAGALIKMAEYELSMALDSKLKLDELFQTLAHEMVHVKQYARGQLKQYKKRNGTVSYTWLGRKYDNEYYDCPWEIEAYSRERVLANKIAQLLIPVDSKSRI